MEHYAIHPAAGLQLYQSVLYELASLFAFLALLILSIYFLLFVCERTFEGFAGYGGKDSLKLRDEMDGILPRRFQPAPEPRAIEL